MSPEVEAQSLNHWTTWEAPILLKKIHIWCHAYRQVYKTHVWIPLQGIFPTQGSKLSHKGSPRLLKWVAYPFSRGSS